MNDDKLMDAAGRLATEIKPERDLWPAIAESIDETTDTRGQTQRGWTTYLAQAAAVVLLVGSSSAVTYMAVKDQSPVVQVASTDMIFEQASFGTRYTLGPGFEDARDALAAELESELKKVSPEARADIETNLELIHNAIAEMNIALAREPENLLLQARLLNTYREELALLRHVSGLTRNVMMRNDI